MSSITNGKYFGTIAIMAALAVGASGGAYYLGGKSKTQNLVYEYKLSDDVKAGNSLEGKVIKVAVPSNQAMDKNKIISSLDELDGMVAKEDLNKFSTVTIDNIVSKEVIGDQSKRNLDFAMPTNVEGTVANSLKPNDLVAIKLKYKDNSASTNRPDKVVVSCIPVSELRTADGSVIATKEKTDDSSSGGVASNESQSTQTPAFILFHVTNDESATLNMASKEGTLYIVKYLDVSQDKLKEDYKPSGVNSTDDSKTTDSTDTQESTKDASKAN